MTSRRRQELERALDRHLTNGVIKDWHHYGPRSRGYSIILANHQAIRTEDMRYVDMICMGLDSASQAWRDALPGQGKSPAEAKEMALGLADRLAVQARQGRPDWQAVAAEQGMAFREILGIAPVTILEQLEDWHAQGAIGFVIPTDPMGMEWIIGVRDRDGTPALVKLGHDLDSATEQAAAFIAGIGQGAMWGIRATLARLGERPDPDLERMFAPQEEPAR